MHTVLGGVLAFTAPVFIRSVRLHPAENERGVRNPEHPKASLRT